LSRVRVYQQRARSPTDGSVAVVVAGPVTVARTVLVTGSFAE
jgi:hypothetical protein